MPRSKNSTHRIWCDTCGRYRWVGPQTDYTHQCRKATGTYTIHPSRTMHWRHPNTGIVGVSNTIAAGLAYADAGYKPIGRRKIRNKYIPGYTCGGPDHPCDCATYNRIINGRQALIPEEKIMNVCRECKQTIPNRKAQYCDNGVCGRMHAQRASKIRHGLIPPHVCPMKARMLAQCVGCQTDCRQCHNTHRAELCARGRRVTLRGQTRRRHVVPADCRECPHIST